MPLVEVIEMAGAFAKDDRVAAEITSLPVAVLLFKLCKNCDIVKTDGVAVADLTTRATSCGTIFPVQGMAIGGPKVMLPTLKTQV